MNCLSKYKRKQQDLLGKNAIALAFQGINLV